MSKKILCVVLCLLMCLSLLPVGALAAEESPVEEFPIEEIPTEEIPTEEVPAEETPIEETPIEVVPEEAPIEETPIEESPVEEPIEEAPTEEAVEENTPAENSTTYLKDMPYAFYGTYTCDHIDPNPIYGYLYQSTKETLILNENELSTEMIMTIYSVQDGEVTLAHFSANKYKFDETGFHVYYATESVDGNPQYSEVEFNPDYKIDDLINNTEVEFVDKESSLVGEECYKITPFGTMNFYFYNMLNGTAQTAIMQGYPCNRVAQADPDTDEKDGVQITDTTTEWSGRMTVSGTVVIDSDVTLSKNTTIILSEGASLTVNGTISTGEYYLSVAASDPDTGTLTVNGTEAGIDGSLCVENGHVFIYGGESAKEKDDEDPEKEKQPMEGNPGIRNGFIAVYGGELYVQGTGKSCGIEAATDVFVGGGNVTVIGGSEGGGISTDEFSYVEVRGGSLTVKAGGSACGVSAYHIAVLDEGSAMITGGSNGGAAVDDTCFVFGDENINAECSDDGINYRPFDPGILFESQPYAIRMTQKESPTESTDPVDPTNPTKPTDPDHPATGDESLMGLWITVMLVSAMGFAVCITKKKRVK